MDDPGGDGPPVPPGLRAGLSIIIAAVWSACAIADLAVDGFDLSPWVGLPMLGMAAAVFGPGFTRAIDRR